jgi:adenine-specific DNA-methyltransferase
MLIWGENLASLAALKAGSGTTGEAMSVDVILIDPPYNVGNGTAHYKNLWKGKSEKERHWAGDHGEFLDFMEPRLKIGRSLLKEDGIIFVNICDGEYTRLKILMDEVFGESNCMGTLIWNKNQGSAGQFMAAVHEYILVYAKNASKAPQLLKEKPSAKLMVERAKELKQLKIGYNEAQHIYKKWVSELASGKSTYKEDELDSIKKSIRQSYKKTYKDEISSGVLTLLCDWLKADAGNVFIGSGESPYKNLDPQTFRPFQATPSCAHDKPETRCQKKLKHPITGKGCKVPSKGWKWSEPTLDKMASYKKYFEGDSFVIAGQIVYGIDEKTVPRKLQYLDEKMYQVMPSMINISYGGQKDLPEGIEFSTPKPISLNKELLSAIHRKDITVLDYFAGSGATAHAVHELNKEDGGQRRWIMVEEMASTFHNVLLKRCEHFDKEKDYSIFELKEVGIKSEQLFEVFEQYSFDFLSAYHTLNEDIVMSAEGMNILGHDVKLDQVVAMTMPQNREDDHFFEEELAVLKDAIKKSKAKNVLIYSLTKKGSAQEPWLGVDKSILTGTKCKKLQIVEIPDQLVDEWNEVLTAMAA